MTCVLSPPEKPDLRQIKVTSFEKAVVFNDGDVFSLASGSASPSSRSSLERISEAGDGKDQPRRPGSRSSSGAASPTNLSPSLGSPSLEPKVRSRAKFGVKILGNLVLISLNYSAVEPNPRKRAPGGSFAWRRRLCAAAEGLIY